MERGYLNDDRRKGIIRLNNALKSALAHQQNMFEGMNIRYFGPYDGNDVTELVRILRQIKDMKGPKLLHLHTKKGKGYKPAEESATIWHAPGKFDPETGKRLKSESAEPQPPKFQDVFGETLLELARQNDRIVGVTPAMPSGSSLSILMNEMPTRAFDVGIAEGHAVTFSAGMAKDGLLPFCAIYSAFSQRAYDSIIHDLSILNLPVVLCLDRSGLVGEDGATHHGAFDMAALRPVPNLTIASPMDERELRRLMFTAQLPEGDPKPGDVAVLTIGPVGNDVQRVIQTLAEEGNPQHHTIFHYDMRFLKPLDERILQEVGSRFDRVVTIEDGIRTGGMGSAVLEWMSDHGFAPRMTRLGMPDRFVEQGTVGQLRHLCGYGYEDIKELLSKE